VPLVMAREWHAGIDFAVAHHRVLKTTRCTCCHPRSTTTRGCAMGKLLDLFRSVPAPRQPVHRVSGQMVDVEIVGESFHQDYIRQVRQRYRDGEFEIVLVAEPTNPYDSNAVAVHVDGCIVGHLAREMAPAWQPMVLAAAAEGS
jgi:hypothetical protein